MSSEVLKPQDIKTDKQQLGNSVVVLEKIDPADIAASVSVAQAKDLDKSIANSLSDSSIVESNISITSNVKSDKNKERTKMSADITDSESDDSTKKQERRDKNEKILQTKVQLLHSTPKIRIPKEIPKYKIETASKMDISQLITCYRKLSSKAAKGRTNAEALKYLEHILNMSTDLQMDCINNQIRLQEQQEIINNLKKENQVLQEKIEEQNLELQNIKGDKEQKILKGKRLLNDSRRRSKILAREEISIGRSPLQLNDTAKSFLQEDNQDNDLSQSQRTQERMQFSQKPQRVEKSKDLKFNPLMARTMALGDLLANYVALTRRRMGGDAEEAAKYYEELQRKSQDIYRYMNDLEKENRNLKDKNRNITTLEQVLKDQKQEINYLKAQNKVLEQNNQHKEDEELNKSRIQMLNEMGSDIAKLNEENQSYKQQITELEETLKNRDEVLTKLLQNNKNEVPLSNIQIIMETLSELRRDLKLEKIMEDGMRAAKQHNEKAQPCHQTYSEIAGREPPTTVVGEKHHHIYSKSAILIKRTRTSNMSLTDIATILTRETRLKSLTKDILCELARDRNTLIIKTKSDETTHKLLEIIEDIASLKDIIDITLKSANLKKLIILGIPADITKEEIIQDLNENFKKEYPVNIYKEIKRPGLRTYQLVIEVEDWIAQHLLNKQKIRYGFNNCRVLPYMPVVRCNYCQRYGHTEQNCNQQRRCKFCAGKHTSNTCNFQNTPSKYRCVNCIGTDCDFPHHAGSTECPTFQIFLQKRNTLAQKNFQNSVM